MSNAVRTLTGPVYWASALVNGDQSSLTADEVTRMNAWLERELQPGESIVSTHAEPRFTWSFRLYGGECDGGEVIDYVVIGGSAS
jgi:hypothetical protein